MAPTLNKDHVLIFPFMAKGHTIPLLHLSCALSLRGLKVTLLTTPASSPFFHAYLHLPQPNIHLLHLPFPSSTNIPPGCESTDSLPTIELFCSFIHATKLFAEPFRHVLQNMADSDDLPLFVVSDFFLGWTRPICEEEFGIPRLVFHGTCAFSLYVPRAIQFHQVDMGADSFHVPGTPESFHLSPDDMSSMYQSSHPVMDIVKECAPEDHNSWGTIVNSFAYLELNYASLLDAFHNKGSRAWLVGPLSLYSFGTHGASAPDKLLRWLDGRSSASVVYVSFGTHAEVSDLQLDEMARGLRMSGWDFILVVRSRSWSPPAELLTWLEGESRAMLCREMVPQKEILAHAATGGFLSHCGWNSVLEGVSAGVPILAWPMFDISEQGLNAKYVADELGVGLRIKRGGGEEVVSREEVCKGVRELMEGEGGKRAREKVEELAKMARAAVEEGGSSQKTLDELIRELRSLH